MDVHCANCNEPWEGYHLRHDEVHETEQGMALINEKLDLESMPAHLVEPVEGERWEGKLTPFWREQFKANGWRFAGSLYAVLRCPCCKDNGTHEGAEDRALKATVVAELLGDDEDGILSELAD